MVGAAPYRHVEQRCHVRPDPRRFAVDARSHRRPGRESGHHTRRDTRARDRIVLEGVDPELAVARGAAYYARARRSGGLRIRGGIAQSYYIGIERAELAVPGVAPRVDAVCVAPFGLEEGSEVQLDRAFGIVLGEPVSFRFFGSSSRHDDEVGSTAKLRDLSELPPIETTLDGEAGEVAHVKLVVRVTEVGTLEIQAVDATKDRRWNLSFNLSSKVRGTL